MPSRVLCLALLAVLLRPTVSEREHVRASSVSTPAPTGSPSTPASADAASTTNRTAPANHTRPAPTPVPTGYTKEVGVNIAVRLAYRFAEFTPSEQERFTRALATAAGVDTGLARITNIEAVHSVGRRRLLSGGGTRVSTRIVVADIDTGNKLAKHNMTFANINLQMRRTGMQRECEAVESVRVVTVVYSVSSANPNDRAAQNYEQYYTYSDAPRATVPAALATVCALMCVMWLGPRGTTNT